MVVRDSRKALLSNITPTNNALGSTEYICSFKATLEQGYKLANVVFAAGLMMLEH